MFVHIFVFAVCPVLFSSAAGAESVSVCPEIRLVGTNLVSFSRCPEALGIVSCWIGIHLIFLARCPVKSSVSTAVDSRVGCPECRLCWRATNLGCAELAGINSQFSSFAGCLETCWRGAILLSLSAEIFIIEPSDIVSILCCSLSLINGNDFVSLTCCFEDCWDGSDFIRVEALWYITSSLKTRILAADWVEEGDKFFADCSTGFLLPLFTVFFIHFSPLPLFLSLLWYVCS